MGSYMGIANMGLYFFQEKKKSIPEWKKSLIIPKIESADSIEFTEFNVFRLHLERLNKNSEKKNLIAIL